MNDEHPGSRAPRPATDAELRLLISSIQDCAIFMLDPQGRVSSWNSGARALKGYEAEEIIGQHFSRFYGEADRAAGLPSALLERALAEGRCEQEGWRLHKSGARFWANAVITPVRDQGGALLGFAKITRDLSERKLAEAELAASAQVLRTMAEGVILVRRSDMIIIYANLKAEQTLGYAEGGLIGKPISISFGAGRESPEGLMDRLDQELNQHGVSTYEARRLRIDGSSWWARVNVTQFD